MPVARCPGCNLLFTGEEAVQGRCPSCDAPLPGLAAVSPPAAPAPTPTPVADPPRASGWWAFLGGAVFGGLMALAGVATTGWAPAQPALKLEELDRFGALLQEKQQAEEQARTARREVEQARAETRQAEAKRTLAENALQAGRTQQQALEKARAVLQTQLAQAQAELKEQQARPPAVQREPARPGRPALPEIRGEGRRQMVVHLAEPRREYQAPPLREGTTLKVTGQIKTLIVTSVDSGAHLDAGELKCEEVVVRGGINGRSTVQLQAERLVTVADVNGGARLDIRVPTGKIVIRQINGNAQVDLLAKEIHLIGAVNGERTTVKATLTQDGKLHCNQLLGKSQLHWHKAKPGDPEPQIQQGNVGPAAEFRRVE